MTRYRVSAMDVISVVSKITKVPEGDILGDSRMYSIKDARHISIYLMRTMIGLSYPEIGAVFGKTHATAMHAVKSIGRRRQNESGLHLVVDAIRDTIIASCKSSESDS